MKSKSFLKHFTVIGFGTIINMILGLITTPIITRIVNPNEYGQLSIFTMYSNIAVMILCLGLDQALIRFYYEKQEESYKKKLLYSCVKIPFTIFLILSVIIIFLYYFKIVNINISLLILFLFLLYTLTQIIYRFSLIIIRLEYKSKLYSILNILLKVFYIILAFFLLILIKNNHFEVLVIATTISAILCLIISIFAQRKKWNFYNNDYSNEKIKINELLKYSLPFIVTMGVTTLFQAIDKISLSIFGDYSDVGIYASTMSLVHVFAIVQTTFNTLWAPMAIEHYTANPEDKSFYEKGNQYITVIMFFIGVSLILFKDVFAILLGEKYRLAAYILPFLIFNPIMYTISETTVNGLVFYKKSKMQVLVAVGACVSNLIGNLILVPELGCKGAAISTGLSYIIFFTMRTTLSNKYYYIDFKLKKFYILTFVVSLYALYNTFIEFNILSIVFYSICVTFLVCLYFSSIKEMFAYVKKFLSRDGDKKNV